MGFGLGDVFGVIGAGADLVGGLIGRSGARKQARALEGQAALALEIGEEAAAAQLELSEIEAGLIELAGDTQQEIAAFNAAVAEENARFEELSGQIAESQARRLWENNIGQMRVGFAAQGRVLTGDTPNAVIEEAFGEMDKDLANIRLSAANRAARERNQGSLFTLQGIRAAELATEQARGTRRAGEIEAEGILRPAEIDAATGRISADAARTRGTASLLGGISGAATDLFNIFGNRS